MQPELSIKKIVICSNGSGAILHWDNYVRVSGVGWVDLPPVFRYKEVCIPVTTYQ